MPFRPCPPKARILFPVPLPFLNEYPEFGNGNVTRSVSYNFIKLFKRNMPLSSRLSRQNMLMGGPSAIVITTEISYRVLATWISLHF